MDDMKLKAPQLSAVDKHYELKRSMGGGFMVVAPTASNGAHAGRDIYGGTGASHQYPDPWHGGQISLSKPVIWRIMPKTLQALKEASSPAIIGDDAVASA